MPGGESVSVGKDDCIRAVVAEGDFFLASNDKVGVENVDGVSLGEAVEKGSKVGP